LRRSPHRKAAVQAGVREAPRQIEKAVPSPPARTEKRKSPAPAPPPPARAKPLATFDRRSRQKLARGREEIEARLDLHGMTQSEAHAALVRFLRRAQADGIRYV